MKIAINAAFYQPKGGGIKEYIDNLLINLSKLSSEHQFIVYVLQDQFEYAKNNLPDKFKIKRIPFKSGSKWNRIKRSLFERRFWLKEEKDENIDLFHSPFFHAPKLKRAKTLLTVHDLRLYRFPETYEFFRYQFLKRKVIDSIKRADHIISISNFTKDEMVQLCNVSPQKITVIHEAINRDRFSTKGLVEPTELPDSIKTSPFLLTVGHMEPRKNYDRLLNSFIKLKNKSVFKDLQLVIVGKKDHSFKETLNKIETTPDVHYLNFVSGNSLIWLYKNASLFVFPSYYEGFGFPPLEAAALDTVSAVSKISSIPEVCGDAAFYFDPYDEEEMSKVIENALLDPEVKDAMLKKVRQRLNDFSWEKNAAETLEVYKNLGR